MTKEHNVRCKDDKKKKGESRIRGTRERRLGEVREEKEMGRKMSG